MAAKLKALQQWCKIRCDGYRDVNVTNLTSSWKSGLAFCAIIHRYRPDLIDYDSLSKENVFENNKLAFDVARDHLDIPALLDAEDMVAMAVPDKLCIVTYVAQYHNYFRDKEQLGGPGVKSRVSTKRPAPSSPPPSVKKFGSDKCADKRTAPLIGNENRTTFTDKCTLCAERVYVLERHFDGKKLYHRRCFRNAERSSSVRSPSHCTATEAVDTHKMDVSDVERKTNSDNVISMSCDRIPIKPAGQVSASRTMLNSGKTVHVEAKSSQPRTNGLTPQRESANLTPFPSRTLSPSVLSPSYSPRKSPSSLTVENCTRQSNISKSPTQSPNHVSPSHRHFPQAQVSLTNIPHKAAIHEKIPVESNNRPIVSHQVRSPVFHDSSNSSAQNKDVVVGLMHNLQKLRRESEAKSPEAKSGSSLVNTDFDSSKQSPTGVDPHKISSFDYTLSPEKNAAIGSHAASPTSPAFKPSPRITSLIKSPNMISPPAQSRSQLSPTGLKLSAPPQRPKALPNYTGTTSPRSANNELNATNGSATKLNTYQRNLDNASVPAKSILKTRSDLAAQVDEPNKAIHNGRDTSVNRDNRKSGTDTSGDMPAVPPRPLIPKWNFNKNAKTNQTDNNNDNQTGVSTERHRIAKSIPPTKISGGIKLNTDQQSSFNSANRNAKIATSSHETSDVSVVKPSTDRQTATSRSTQSPVSRGDNSGMSQPKSIVNTARKDVDPASNRAPQQRGIKSGELDWQVEARRRENLRGGKYQEPDSKTLAEPNKNTAIKRAELFYIKDSPPTQPSLCKQSPKESMVIECKQRHSIEPLKTVRNNHNNAEDVKSTAEDGEQKTEWQKEVERRKSATGYNNGEPISHSPRSVVYPTDTTPVEKQPVPPPRKRNSTEPVQTSSIPLRSTTNQSRAISDHSQTTSRQWRNVSTIQEERKTASSTEIDHENKLAHTNGAISEVHQQTAISTQPIAPQRKRFIAATSRFSFNAHDFNSAVDGSPTETNHPSPPTIPLPPNTIHFTLRTDKSGKNGKTCSPSDYKGNTYSPRGYKGNTSYSLTGYSRNSPDENKANTISPDSYRAMQVPKRRVNAEVRMSVMQISTSLYHLDVQLRDLEDYGRELEVKIRQNSDDAMETNDDLMIQWFGLVNQKNELVRKETDLMYRKKQQELEDIHEDLEFEYRCLMEKPEHLKTSSERIREHTLLTELLDTVSQRNSIVDNIEDDRIRYIKEDEEIANVLADQARGAGKKKKDKKQKKRNAKKST